MTTLKTLIEGKDVPHVKFDRFKCRRRDVVPELWILGANERKQWLMQHDANMSEGSPQLHINFELPTCGCNRGIGLHSIKKRHRLLTRHVSTLNTCVLCLHGFDVFPPLRFATFLLSSAGSQC